MAAQEVYGAMAENEVHPIPMENDILMWVKQ